MNDLALRDVDGDPEVLTGTRLDTLIGAWSARVIFAIGIAYVVTLGSGFVSLGNRSGDNDRAFRPAYRRPPINPSTVPGFDRLFGWHWPSMMWGAEITAWDLFLGLSLLCAVPVFAGRQYATVRRGLLISGSLCLAGLLGPALNTMAWRQLGILGYAVVLPLTCLALSRAFATASTPFNGRRRRDDSAISQEVNTH